MSFLKISFYINFLAGQFFPRRPTCLFQKFHRISGTFQFFCWHRVFWFSRAVIPTCRIRISPKRQRWANGSGTVITWRLQLNTMTKKHVAKTKEFQSFFQSHSSGLYLCQDVVRHVDLFPWSQLISARWSSRVNGGVASIASSTNPIGPPKTGNSALWHPLRVLLFTGFCWVPLLLEG